VARERQRKKLRGRQLTPRETGGHYPRKLRVAMLVVNGPFGELDQLHGGL
jgi:hypothetical protein